MFIEVDNDIRMSILHMVQANFAVSTEHHVINTSDPLTNNSTITIDLHINKSTHWCHDLQGSDFIYAPTLYSSTVRHVIAFAFILVMAVTVIGNAIVIIIVITDRPLRRITSQLVLSMAVADILVAMCGELQSVIMMLSTDTWALSDTLCEVFTSVDLYFSLSGLLHIVSLAGDRYLSICYPFKYERWGHKYMVVSITTSWTLPLAFSFLPIMGHWYKIGLEELYSCLQSLETHTCTLFPNKGFSTASFTVMFALPSALMCYCYLHIYKVAMKQRKRMCAITLGVYIDVNDTCTLNQKPMISVDSDQIKLQQNCKQAAFSHKGSTNYIHPDITDIIDNIDNQADILRKPQPEPLIKHHFMKCQRHGYVREDFRAAKSISVVFLCFTITWSPYWFTILIMPYLGPNAIPDPVIGACLWLAYFGSALNPFVYYFSNRAVKTGIRLLLLKLFHRIGQHNRRSSIILP